MSPPLIARIAALRQRRAATPPRTIEWHELHTEVRALEAEFVQQAVDAYRAGVAVAERHPLTSAEVLAALLAPHLEAFTAEVLGLALAY